MKKLFSFLLVATLVGVVAPSAPAMVLVDYSGYAYETGGLLPSDPGDVLVFTVVATGVDPVLGIDLGTTEITFYLYDLVSTGEGSDGFGNTVITYTGGTLEMWADGSLDAEWGVFPPNATVPSSFANGTLLFQGVFTSFTLVLSPFTGGGAYEGTVDGIGGSLISGCVDCAYTWGGAFTPDSGAQILDGYDLQIDGALEFDPAIRTETSSWGQVKSLYGQE